MATFAGVVLAAVVRHRRRFLAATLTLTALSIVPSIVAPDDTATTIVLVGTHLLSHGGNIPRDQQPPPHREVTRRPHPPCEREAPGRGTSMDGRSARRTDVEDTATSEIAEPFAIVLGDQLAARTRSRPRPKHGRNFNPNRNSGCCHLRSSCSTCRGFE